MTDERRPPGGGSVYFQFAILAGVSCRSTGQTMPFDGDVSPSALDVVVLRSASLLVAPDGYGLVLAVVGLLAGPILVIAFDLKTRPRRSN